jgi:hypothetical protein
VQAPHAAGLVPGLSFYAGSFDGAHDTLFALRANAMGHAARAHFKDSFAPCANDCHIGLPAGLAATGCSRSATAVYSLHSGGAPKRSAESR